MIKEISVSDLNAALNSSDDPVLLDVREPWEFAMCRIQGSVNVPMQSIPMESNNLDKSKHYIAICHHGSRSLQVTQYLAAQGFDISNLAGGVDAWASDIDPAMPRY